MDSGGKTFIVRLNVNMSSLFKFFVLLEGQRHV